MTAGFIVKKLFLFIFGFNLLMINPVCAQYSKEQEGEIAKDPLKWRKENIFTQKDNEKFRNYRIKVMVEQSRKKERQEIQCRENESPMFSELFYAKQIMDMMMIKAKRNHIYFPHLHEELLKNDFDVIFIIIGAGFNKSHQRPEKIVEEAVNKGKRVKILNIDPVLEYIPDEEELNINHIIMKSNTHLPNLTEVTKIPV